MAVRALSISGVSFRLKRWLLDITWKYKYGRNEAYMPFSKYGLLGEKLSKEDIDKERNIDAAFDIVCGGVLYKPKECKLAKNYKYGCGKCGKGMSETCGWK